MQNTKSHMVSKLIFANILAVIMMSYEQHAPAEVKEKPQKVMGDQSIKTDAVIKVSDSQPLNTAKQSAMVKKPMYKTRNTSKAPHPHVVKVKSAPVDCCFRGYKS